MGTLEVPFHQLTGVSFSLYSSDEIRKLSVKEITNPVSLDALHHSTYGGLYDPALGATEADEVCGTCGQNYIHCPGHMGHINLPMPVYNPVLFQTMVKLLKGTCFRCRRLMAGRGRLHTFQSMLRALDFGLISLVNELQDKFNEVNAKGGDDKVKDIQAIEAIDAYLEEATRDKDEKESLHSANVKNVVEYRHSLCKDFINGTLWGTRCPHCSFPSRPLRTEHNTKVFFYKGVTKDVINRFFNQKLRETQAQRKQKQQAAEEGEDINEVLIAEDEAGEEKFDPVALEKELAELENQQYLTPTEVRRHLRLVWEQDGKVLAKVFKSLELHIGRMLHPTDIFFIDVMPVPPSRFRPRAALGDLKFDNAQTATYTKVLECAIGLRAILRDMAKKPLEEGTDIGDEGDLDKTIEGPKKSIPGKTDFERLNSAWIRLQTNVNCVVDMDLDKLSTEKQPGIKQLIEKKQGLFRMNMMGKRVNYACRSVISPDPYINTNEVGIPKVFATRLTYPQPVTPWNFQELKQAVINGPDIYPGASLIETEDGNRIILHAKKPMQREALAKQLLTPSADGKLGSKKVYRHLKNGDVLLLNRQPTLHRPSIQAHKARVLGNEKTLRLHYANCKAYNADFDGDEMNAHFPQDEISRAEAYTIAATDFQYLVPKDGTPLAGLIQDHMVSGVTLTLRGQFFCRSDYHHLVYRALTDKGGPIRLLPPSILKPQVLWSGKQVLSTVLINIIPERRTPLNLTGSAKVAVKNWNSVPARRWRAGGEELEGNDMSETEVVILGGELLVGVLDKGHYGPTAYGLVHSCYELYGGPVAGRLLTCLAKLFTCFLQLHGFTLGVEDILCLPEADEKRQKFIEESTRCGPEAVTQAFNVSDPSNEEELLHKYEEAHYSKEGELKDLDLAMKGKTDEFQNKIAKVTIPNGLLKHFPHNNLQLMVQSGAKGSSVNCMQISCLLGQIELEGRRPPLMLNGKPLPSFPAYDMRPRAGGFVTGRFLTGVKPQEYYFHCMAGREGLVDTAVKTSRSGYLQRCIIKHLEGLVVNYDQTVRDSDGSIVQFHYGEDGLDIAKTQFLREKQMPFLISNKEQLISPGEEDEITRRTDTETAPRLWKKLAKWKKKHQDNLGHMRSTPFLNFCKKKWASVIEQYPDVEVRNGRREAAHTVCDMWRNLDDEKRTKYTKMGVRAPDPILSTCGSAQHLGVVSEKYQQFMDDYIGNNPDNLVKYDEEEVGRGHISAERLRSLLYIRNLKARVPPGEAVGLLAAQSIGEPSTQMTLNTFHFAGRGEMNVTLGIPRLREILMVASAAIKTPNMDVPILPGHAAMKKAKLLKKKFTKVYLSQVLEDLEVTETLCIKNDKGIGRSRVYKLRFSFLPHEMYKDDFYLTPAKVLQYMERRFLLDLEYALRRRREDLSRSSLLKTGTLKERDHGAPEASTEAQRKDEEQDDISDDELHDGDATSAKRRERQQQSRDYQGEEEEREEVEEGEEPEAELLVTNEEADVEKTKEEEEEDSQFNSMDVTLNESFRKKKKRKSVNKMQESRINHILCTINGAVDYAYDCGEELWCEITLKVPLDAHKLDMTSAVEAAARKAVVYQTRDISRCFLSEPKMEGQPARLKIEGVNLRELHKYQDCLDLQNLYTNDIHAVAKVYGVEAASRAIIKEVRDVFAAYGIGVDYRHLSLTADYMTFEGEYKAFNRMGINSNPSPFQKMSFETTMSFLKTAVISGAHDDLKSPSSRIIVGRTVRGGTGCFDLLQPM